jgi:hypothetical protein
MIRQSSLRFFGWHGLGERPPSLPRGRGRLWYEPMVRWLLLSAVTFVGCNRFCSRPEPLTGLDGGVSTCVQSTDCPRPSSVLVCGDNEDHLRGCIDCTDNRCVRYYPEACP